MKVVGTATPKEPSEEQWNASWKFSTGDELLIQWNLSTSTSTSRPSFYLKNETSPVTTVKDKKGVLFLTAKGNFFSRLFN